MARPRYIELTQGRRTKVDAHLYPVLSWQKWQYSQNGYARFGFVDIESGKRIFVYLHRSITKCPDDMEVHHINGDKLDNRLSNLLVVSHAEHMALHAEG